MLPKRKTVVRGQVYESRLAAMKDLGVSYNTLVNIMEEEGQTINATLPVTWNGFTFSSRAIAAKALGITVWALKYRLRMGYTCDADMHIVRRKAKQSALRQASKIKALGRRKGRTIGTVNKLTRMKQAFERLGIK